MFLKYASQVKHNNYVGLPANLFELVIFYTLVQPIKDLLNKNRQIDMTTRNMFLAFH